MHNIERFWQYNCVKSGSIWGFFWKTLFAIWILKQSTFQNISCRRATNKECFIKHKINSVPEMNVQLIISIRKMFHELQIELKLNMCLQSRKKRLERKSSPKYYIHLEIFMLWASSKVEKMIEIEYNSKFALYFVYCTHFLNVIPISVHEKTGLRVFMQEY